MQTASAVLYILKNEDFSLVGATDSHPNAIMKDYVTLAFNDSMVSAKEWEYECSLIDERLKSQWLTIYEYIYVLSSAVHAIQSSRTEDA